MRNLRRRLRRAVLAVPLAASACFSPPPAAGEASTGGGGSNGGAHSTGGGGTSGFCLPGPVAGGGCSACDPVADVCVDERCQPTCNTCGGCLNTETTTSFIPDPAGVPPMGFGFTCYDACTPTDGGAGPDTCHVEALPDGGARGTPDGGLLVVCTWDNPPATCASPDPCAACDPARSLCDVTTGACSRVCGCACAVTTTVVPTREPLSDAGELDSTVCQAICPHPDAGYYSFGPECHVEYSDTGAPLSCDGVETVACVWNADCTGRRPEGFAPSASRPGWGAYLATAASLEAASITAFRRLERELRDLGAPPELQRRARAAAHDEVRHARTMGELARRAGQRRERLHLEAPRPRSPAEIACENAVEGCVRETFGAALALWQADHAEDPHLRAAMLCIAEDEAEHAQLAWDIAAWLEPRLSETERARARAERESALADLQQALHTAAESELRSAAGLPSAAEATHLFEALTREVWRMAA